MALITDNKRYSAFPSEVLNILSTKLTVAEFNTFATAFNNYANAKDTELANLKTDINNLNQTIANNLAEINTLKSVKADRAQSLLKDADGNYNAGSLIRANFYTFFEDKNTGIKRKSANEMAFIVDGQEIMIIDATGNIKLPKFSGNSGEVLVFGIDGTITCNGIKLKNDNGVLKFYEGTTWVAII